MLKTRLTKNVTPFHLSSTKSILLECVLFLEVFNQQYEFRYNPCIPF